MKRFICILLIVLMCLCLGGCGENNYPTAAYEMLTNAVNNADTELVKSNIKDVAGFRSVMHELAYTIDKDRRFEVNFLYEDFDDNDVYEIPAAISGVAKRMNSDEYRRELEASFISTFLETLQSDQTTVSDNGSLHATILRWQTKSFFGKISSYALCDFDGDGAWDYGAKTDGDTLDMSFIKYSSNKNLPQRKINEYQTVFLSCNKEVTELKDLSGSETMKDFEQLL